jgi:hypothetical protein
MGGIKLRVLGEDVEEANKILNQKSEETQVDFTIENSDLICPKCGPNNTATEKYSKLILGLSWLILGFPIAMNPGRRADVFYCGHVWDN